MTQDVDTFRKTNMFLDDFECAARRRVESRANGIGESCQHTIHVVTELEIAPTIIKRFFSQRTHKGTTYVAFGKEVAPKI